MKMLAYAMNYWSKGTMKALFLEHEVPAYTVRVKNPPLRLSDIFPKQLGFFSEFLVQILYAYYTLPSTLDYKFVFNYLQL